MEYTKTNWENGAVALSAENMNHIEKGIEDACTEINGMTSSQALFDAIYPVGSIYMSVNNTNPGTLFGGTWAAWGEGKVPVGVNTSDTDFSTVEQTGGSKDAIIPQHNHTATFTGSALGNHNHTQNQHRHNGYESAGENLRYVMVDADATVSNVALGKQASPTDTYYGPRSSQSYTGFSAAKVTDYTTATNNAASAGTPSGTVSVANKGESVTGKNLQPYITCYMWKRTA